MQFRPSLLIVLTLCSFNLLLAESNDGRGRLPDGRAYRLDEQGNEIVDYIAELELSVESMNRRVTGLEDEVQEKNLEIERLSRGHPAQPLLREKNLVADQKMLQRDGREEFGVNNASKEVIECPVCPKFNCSKCIANCEADCKEATKNWEERFAACENKLRVKAGVEEEQLELDKQVASLRREIEAREVSVQELKLRLRHASSTMNALQESIKESEEKRSMLEREVEVKHKEFVRVQAQAEAEKLAAKKAAVQCALALNEKDKWIRRTVVGEPEQPRPVENRLTAWRLAPNMQ